MYLDGKRIAIIITTGVLAMLMWWLTGTRNTHMIDRIEEMETGTSSNPKIIAAQQTEYLNTVNQAISHLKNNQFNSASRLLARAYPEFENYLNYQGHTEMGPNLTLRQWHDQQAKVLIVALEQAYERAKQLVAQGDYSHMDLRDFLHNTPFPYIGLIKPRWQTDQVEVKAARVANAGNWVIVNVLGSMGSSTAFEDVVRAALSSKWPKHSQQKLVFGGTMSQKEKQTAFRVIQVSIEGDKVSYQFAEKSDKQGSSTFHETLTTKFILLSKNDSQPSTSWDQLSEIVAHHKAPENLTATFDRFDKKQEANFSKILEAQKEALQREFEQQLTTIPVFAQNR
ncbi:MAG: hypothetical protein O3C43_00650 [Verrucomicrobia bacterium]|nr:hypothetical protein [Verrucomicrobiota bacterium]MDA1064986.1 hypothetical protein [Verrucomicrobiota bacterium]